jgi:RsiW-degrading membrane proteinase PrsW (M82 family)
MHWHRISAFLLGCLILGSLFMIFVATQNFGTVDRVLAQPPEQAAQMFQTLGPAESRLLLRYLAGEENRLFFTSWELAQIGLAALLTAILLLAIGSRLMAGMSGAVLILALFQHFRVTPQMIAFGRVIDFGAGAGSAAYNQFWRLHALYGVLEVVKLGLLIVVAAILLFGRRAKNPDPVEATSPVAPSFAEP